MALGRRLLGVPTEGLVWNGSGSYVRSVEIVRIVDPVEHADSFWKRWRGLRPVAAGRRMLFRARCVHGFGMREPLWAVGLDSGQVVVAVRELRPRSLIRIAGAVHILELPLSDRPPRVGQRVRISLNP